MPPSAGLILCLVPVLVLRVASAVLSPRDSEDHDQAIPTWLPRSLDPLHYSVRIRPVIQEGNFTAPGEVTFTFRPKSSSTRSIFLNVRNLTIDEFSTKVEEEGSPCRWIGVNVLSQSYNSEKETFEVILTEALKNSGVRYRLTLRYVALIQDNLKGLYRSQYEDENNNKRWMAVTQLGPTNARALFPCMDEPQYKARFTISVARLKQYKSVSNMPLKAVEPIKDEPDWVWDHFHTTVPMSTYLVAVAVFDFERFGGQVLPNNSTFSLGSTPGSVINGTDVVHGLFNLSGEEKDEVLFGVWAPKHKVARGAYAANIGPRILKFYSQFFNLSFPLPKQDMIMVPHFHFSAMENWGLIMYRESALLVDSSKPESRYNVARTVAHELAHQWFGNLVTMKWWNDIWLNEGFATYVSQLGTSYVEPQWNSEHMFVIENAKTVMKRDATNATHPVSQKIHHVSDIDHIFDSISYKKGASIIRMMGDFLGDKAFHKGLNAYLRKYRFRNAAQDDLWKCLTDAAQEEGVLFHNESVKQIMDTWTLQSGYPVVNITRNYSSALATATQERFLLGGSAATDKQRSNTRWWIPLWLSSSPAAALESPNKLSWLRGAEQTVLQGLPSSNQWVLVNAKQSGFYRVNYDERNWGLLTAAIDHLPELARAGLADDSLALAFGGRLNYSVALTLLDRLPTSQAGVSWLVAIPWLKKLRLLTYSTPAGPDFSDWSRRKASSLYGSLSQLRESSDPVEINFYEQVRAWACGVGVQACLTDTSRELVVSLNETSPKTASPSVSHDRFVEELCSASSLNDGSRDLYESNFIDTYEKFNYSSFRAIILCLKSDVNVQRLLEKVFEKNTTQHAPSEVFEDLIKWPNSNEVAMKFLQENLDNSGGRFTEENLVLTSHFVKTKEHYSFVERNLQHIIGRQDVQMALAQGRNNIWWLENQISHFSEALRQKRF